MGEAGPAVTGVGVLAADVAAVSGAGDVGSAETTGTGALAAVVAAVSGAGVSVSTGTGVLAAQTATAAGVGVSASSGTGALAAQNAAASGAGVSASTGTGALAAARAAANGIGTSASAGTGALQAAAAAIVGAGVSAYGGAIFHLFCHAFFKALLFLCAGSVIHAMSSEQDMRKMGGIWRAVWMTYILMWIGSLALGGIGIPGVYGFAGFYSKDAILEAAWEAHTVVGHYGFWLGAIAAGMTGFYSWRLLFMTFHGPQHADEKVMAHVHESPPVMLLPLVVLAVGAVLAGIIGYDYFVGEDRAAF